MQTQAKMRPLIPKSHGKKNTTVPTPAVRSQPKDLEETKKPLNKTPKSVYRADVNEKPKNKEIIKINQEPSPNLANPIPAEDNSIGTNQQQDILPKINVEKDDAELTAQNDQLQSTTRPASPTTMSLSPTMPVSPEQNKQEFSQPAGAIPIDQEYNSFYPAVQMTQNNTPTEALNNSRMKSLTEISLQSKDCSLKNIERMIQKMHKKIKRCNKDQDNSSSESVSSNSSCTELDKKKTAYLKALDDYCKAKKTTEKKKRVRINCEELSPDSGEERRRRKFKCKEVKPLTKRSGRRSSSCNPPRSDYSLECRPKACTSCIDLDNLTSCTNQALNCMSKAFNVANICPSVCCNYHECCHQEKSSESLSVSCEPDEQPIIKISYSDAKYKKPKQAKKTSCLEKTLNEILCKTKSIQDATEQLTATAPVCSSRSGNASYYMPCHHQQQQQPTCHPSTSMHQPCSPRHCPLPPCPPPPCPRPRCPPPPCPPPLCPPSPCPQPPCPIPYPPPYPTMQYSHTSYLPSPSPLVYPPTGPHPSHPHFPYYTACYSTPYRYQFHHG